MSLLDDDYMRRLVFKYGEPLSEDELTDMLSLLVSPADVKANVDRFLSIRRSLPEDLDVTKEELSTYLQVCNIPAYRKFYDELPEETDLSLIISFVSWKLIESVSLGGPSIYLITAEEWEIEWVRWNS